jgi:hypothetical protein
MQKKIAGLIGAVAALGAFSTAQATPTASPPSTDVLKANSFADLLEPIPNAAVTLQAIDESGPISSTEGNVQLAQYHHHHHHHHHHHYRRFAPRVIIVPPHHRRYHHHHHHHHHHHFRRDW